jgi:hypothetical protein
MRHKWGTAEEWAGMNASVEKHETVPNNGYESLEPRDYRKFLLAQRRQSAPQAPRAEDDCGRWAVQGSE